VLTEFRGHPTPVLGFTADCGDAEPEPHTFAFRLDPIRNTCKSETDREPHHFSFLELVPEPHKYDTAPQYRYMLNHWNQNRINLKLHLFRL
jgi:hypothetical protein